MYYALNFGARVEFHVLASETGIDAFRLRAGDNVIGRYSTLQDYSAPRSNRQIAQFEGLDALEKGLMMSARSRNMCKHTT